MSDAYLPMPDTCHPHYSEQAGGIRELMATSRAMIPVPETRDVPTANFRDKPEPIGDLSWKIRTMEIRKLVGPAPFIGDPRWERQDYYWFAAIDGLGRHVAGEAVLSEPRHVY